MLKTACLDILNQIKTGKIRTPKHLDMARMRAAKKYSLRKLPTNADILSFSEDKTIELLKTKPTRTISGVSVVAVMAKPAKCPGICIYCPKGTNAPQSYTGYEPAAMRAVMNDYDPFEQVANRLDQLDATGHNAEKNELIIMGGTFPAQDWDYQRWFVQHCFDAFNRKASTSLKEAQTINETAKRRVIGLTVETRPDHININQLLELGCTRVELGVQSVYDDVLKAIRRGHDVKKTIDATKLLKDSCFKILYHIMIGLPGSSFEKDKAMFKTLFENPDFKPDMLKIYPTLVIKGTPIYDAWKNGDYTPIDEKYVEKLVTEVYKMCPKWVRIHRIQRDIPAHHINAGPTKSNIRQDIVAHIDYSNEIRFREAGHVFLRTGKTPKEIELTVTKYPASGGTEYFLAAEDVKQNILVGFCRLRITKNKPAMVRELHVYGSVVPIGSEGNVQHKGWGRSLLEKAENIAKKEGKDEIIVISGVGAKEYYRKLGYGFDKGYMAKNLAS